MSAPTIKALVLDTAPFLTQTPLSHLAETFYTLPEVIDEIKDKAAREYIQRLPFKLTLKVPDDKSIQAVTNFSKKTGDIAVLSGTDLKVLALAYMLHVEQCGKDRLRETPIQPRTNLGSTPVLKEKSTSKTDAKTDDSESKKENNELESISDVHVEGLVVSDESTKNEETVQIETSESIEKREGVSDEPESANEVRVDVIGEATTLNETVSPESASSDVELDDPENIIENQIDEMDDEKNYDHDEEINQLSEQFSNDVSINDAMEETDSQPSNEPESTLEAQPSTTKTAINPSESDDEGGWITPKNIAKHKNNSKKSRAKNVSKNMTVACMTADFAMQNVMLQMGLNLISVDGLQIRTVKSWVLRCFACYQVTKQMEKKFCPTCGSPTLIRTSCGVNDDGTVVYYLKKNFQYNLRGTKYSIPKPKSGRHASNIVLREDQKEFSRAMHLASRKQKTTDLFDPDYDPLAPSLGKTGRNTAGGRYAGVGGESTKSKGFGGASVSGVVGMGRKNPNERRRR
ncbi:Nin1 binding protein [Nowakowskiella sp. JEL0407]|nr:Nin1 binding protein [Nowakowskiella sp. JEL0407]